MILNLYDIQTDFKHLILQIFCISQITERYKVDLLQFQMLYLKCRKSTLLMEQQHFLGLCFIKTTRLYINFYYCIQNARRSFKCWRNFEFRKKLYKNNYNISYSRTTRQLTMNLNNVFKKRSLNEMLFFFYIMLRERILISSYSRFNDGSQILINSFYFFSYFLVGFQQQIICDQNLI